jgi:hypothetical protein
MGKFFLFIIAISIFLVLGTAVLVENLAQCLALSIGMRRVTTGRNRERWTQAILPVSDCDSSASVRADI